MSVFEADLKRRLKELDDTSDHDFDFPGQKEEVRQHEIVECAVASADAILSEYSKTAEDLEHYTILVMEIWAKKVSIASNARVLRARMLKEIDESRRDAPESQPEPIREGPDQD